MTIRKKTLEDERIKLASIMNIYNKQNKVLQEMLFRFEELKKESEQYFEQEDFNPSIMSNYYSFSTKLSQDIKTQIQIIERTEVELKEQQEKAKDAYIKVKMLENLKEKQKEKYDKEFLQEEFKIIDDIVSSKRTA